MRKSIDVVIALQGVLRAGAVYVPTDPLAPASRAAFVLRHCHAVAIVVEESLAGALRSELATLECDASLLIVPDQPVDGHAWRIDALASSASVSGPVARSASDIAFVLYTSGSTGAPKAVALTNENVVIFVDWCSRAFSPTERDKFAMHAPLHFSLSVFNLYVAWKHGGALVLIEEGIARMPALLAPVIAQRDITVWFSTPTILGLLAQSGQLGSVRLESLRLIMFAGEAFPLPHLRSLQAQLPDPRYVHVFGSTETHIMAHYEVPRAIPDDRTAPMPMGRVCEHLRSRIVDEDGTDVDPGTEGELCLVGPAITPGYGNALDATARAFFMDAQGERWYRTGDVVRVNPDGDLVHVGRRDRMVKKRGNRIELAEIEACLYGHATVKEAGVVAVPDDELGLSVKAFVVPQAETRPTMIELKAHCAKRLPAYMVPDVFVLRTALPRTSNGKIDFPALKDMR